MGSGERGARRRRGGWKTMVALLMLCGGLWAQRPGWTDSIGVRIEWQGMPQRVVSLAPSLTEEVFAVGAGAQLVGDTNYCVHPAGARSKTKIGSIQKPSIEIILSIHPDLVLATQDGNSIDTVAQLRRLGIRVYTFGPSQRFHDIEANFLTLGALLGRSKQAQARMAQVDAGLQMIEQRLQGAAPRRVFLQLGPGSLYTVNGQTFLSEVLTRAHAVNVMASLPVRYPEVDRESVLKANPDAILVTMEPAPGGSARALASWRLFTQLRAVQRKRVFAVNEDLFNLPTPTDFLASVCAVAHRLYPARPVACQEGGTQ